MVRRSVLAAVVAAFVASAAFGQSAVSQAKVALPEFDVASVRAAEHDGLIVNHTPSLDVEPGRNLNFANISLRDLIVLAYGVGIRQISGPDFLTANRFDIIAKVPGDAFEELARTTEPGSGLKGTYDFKLEWITRGEANNGSDGPTIFDAVQRQLGLKLDGRKQSVDMLVIDHCEMAPTEN
jgi:hypothetical protein